VLKHELAAAEATLENDRKELAAIKAKESSEENSFILGAGGFAGYNEAFEVVNREVADVEANMTQLKSLQTLFTKFLEEAERNQSCSLCKRGFASVEATDAFIQEMKTNMANAPSQIVALEQRVEKTRERRVLLQELGEVASQFKSLSEKVPETERTVSELEQKLKELREKQESIEKELASKQDVRSATAALVEDAGNISRMAKEVEALQASVNELESTSLGSNGATRSAVDIANDIEMLDVKREAADREKSILVKRKERHETELLTLERTARDLREELIVVKSRGDRRAQLKAELAEITGASASGAAEQKRMEEERAPGLAEKENLIRERETQRNTHAREQNDLDAEIRELQRVVDKITGMNAAIEQGKSLGTSERLAEHNKSLEETNTKIETLGTKLQSRSKQLTAKDEVIARQNDLKRELEDNIAFLRGKREEESILKEIEQLTSEMGNMGQVKDIESKLRQVTDRKNDLRAESAEAKGRVKAHEEAMKAANDQLKGAEYVNIEQRLTKQLVEKKTVEMVSEDLDRYHKALDKALMSFHSSKMEEINKVVRELWQRTYRGQDIDSIQIRSDSDGTTGKSSYNYRVVMLCGGAELEMRGRCSAGQKVLACLIIRLALAETFCLNCGILALDEPTTNLDAPNSDALARSLIEIMKSRRDQENFQLIVITHDMEFAHVLGQRELTEYYWRVTKDENQNSLIEKEDIYD
jgi:DNA repair protein RAD50